MKSSNLYFGSRMRFYLTKRGLAVLCFLAIAPMCQLAMCQSAFIWDNDALAVIGTDRSEFISVSVSTNTTQVNFGAIGGNITNTLMFQTASFNRVIVQGREGNDEIVYTSSGATKLNYLYGQDGDDRIYGDTTKGDTELNGGSGDDHIYGQGGNDFLIGEAGNDKLYGGNGNDRLRGNIGNDVLRGDAGDDQLVGQQGNDTLYGGTGNDLLNGGDNEDTLYGGPGDDRMAGGYGDDKLFGNTGNDTMQGDFSTNTNLAGHGDDELYGQEGNDIMLGNGGDDLLEGDDLLDLAGGDDIMDGGSGDDRLVGFRGDDMLYGGLGNDTLNGGRDPLPIPQHSYIPHDYGDDFFDGGPGDDIYEFFRVKTRNPTQGNQYFPGPGPGSIGLYTIDDPSGFDTFQLWDTTSVPPLPASNLFPTSPYVPNYFRFTSLENGYGPGPPFKIYITTVTGDATIEDVVQVFPSPYGFIAPINP